MPAAPHHPSQSIGKELSTMSVLLVEDNFLVAMAMERALVESGCTVVGPVATVEEGTRIAAQTRIDGAILDINIQGGTSQAIAEALERRGLPFFFITGYGSPLMLPERLRRVFRLSKPVNAQRLVEAIAERFRPAPG